MCLIGSVYCTLVGVFFRVVCFCHFKVWDWNIAKGMKVVLIKEEFQGGLFGEMFGVCVVNEDEISSNAHN